MWCFTIQPLGAVIYRRENRVEKKKKKKEKNNKNNRVYFIHGMLYKFIIIHMRIVNGLISFILGWMNAFSLSSSCRILANIHL